MFNVLRANCIIYMYILEARVSLDFIVLLNIQKKSGPCRDRLRFVLDLEYKHFFMFSNFSILASQAYLLHQIIRRTAWCFMRAYKARFI